MKTFSGFLFVAILALFVFTGSASSKPKEIAPPTEIAPPAEVSPPREEVTGPKEIAPPQEVSPPQEVTRGEQTDNKKKEEALKDFDWDKARTQGQYILVPKKSPCTDLNSFGELPVPQPSSLPVYVDVRLYHKVLQNPSLACNVQIKDYFASSFESAKGMSDTLFPSAILIKAYVVPALKGAYSTPATYIFVFIDGNLIEK